MCASTNTGAVLLSFDTSEKPAVVALPAQVVTLKELLQANNDEGGANSKRTSEPGARTCFWLEAQQMCLLLSAARRAWW